MSTPNISNVFASGFAEVLHNVQLLDVKKSDSGCEVLTVEYQGIVEEINGGRWHDQFNSRKDIGRFGELVLARHEPEQTERAFYFRAYIDPTLRRAPELDARHLAANEDGCTPCVIGWRCEARPHGFRAPIGLIPGEGGQFLIDETVPVTVRVPPEFVLACRSVRMTPERVLRSFIGDLSGIVNWAVTPRADGYGSNGSDERDMAEAWLDRAHGMDRIPLDELLSQDEKCAAAEAEIEELGFLLNEWESSGGNTEELFSTIEALIEKKRLSDSEKV